MTRPAALSALSLACLGAALWWPLHPAAWPLIVAAVIAGACSAVGFITAAHALDPPRDPGPSERWPVLYPGPDDLDDIHTDLGLAPRDGDEQ